MSGNFAIKGGGVGRLMANAILNFHFDFLHLSLILTAGICHWVSLEAYLMPNFIQLAQLCMQRMKTEKS